MGWKNCNDEKFNQFPQIYMNLSYAQLGNMMIERIYFNYCISIEVLTEVFSDSFLLVQLL